MQCPSCSSVIPDYQRFCLQCGQYLGEPDESTIVGKSANREPPPTTIRANFTPPGAYTPRGPTFSYEAPIPKRWPKAIAFVVLTAIGLMMVGLLAAMLIRDAGGVRVPVGQSELAVLTTPTPLASTSQRATPTPQPTIVSTPAATPSVEKRDPVFTTAQTDSRDESPEATATPFQPTTVIDWSGFLNDGAARSWRLPRGAYALQLSANNDGATVEWPGSDNCIWKTEPMLRFGQRCQIVSDTGQLVVTNPTTFGLGKAVSVTVRVLRLR
jgi:hypothetical protein